MSLPKDGVCGGTGAAADPGAGPAAFCCQNRLPDAGAAADPGAGPAARSGADETLCVTNGSAGSGVREALPRLLPHAHRANGSAGSGVRETLCGTNGTAGSGVREALCVTNIQRYSLHDGGGIRTVAFVKGCPFHCPWCSNPETLSFEPQVLFHERLCIGCSLRPDGRRDSNGCGCDTSPENCPTEAKELVGQEWNVDALATELMRDRVFFEMSGGGVTVSGGECLAGGARQRAVTHLLEVVGSEGISGAIETTLAVPLTSPETLVHACDTFLVDFKIADRARSLEVCGVDVNLRDKNLEALRRLDAHVIARMPVIPGFTDSRDNIERNASRARELGITRADILPFHQLGESKYESAGMSYGMHGVPQLSEDASEAAAAIVRACGLEVVVHGE